MKNIISNFIGIILIFGSTYYLLAEDLEVLKYSIVITVGFACFYFENDTIKKYISKALDKILK